MAKGGFATSNLVKSLNHDQFDHESFIVQEFSYENKA